MRTYVDPAISAVHGVIDKLNDQIRKTEKEEQEADSMPQGAAKAHMHQLVQRTFGHELNILAAEINRIGTRLKANA